MDSHGNFTVVWQLSDDSVYFQQFAADQTPLGSQYQILPGSAAANNVQLSVLAGGGFVVVWQSYASGVYSINAEQFDSSGQGGGAFAVTSGPGEVYFPTVVAEPDGGFFVAWSGYNASGVYQGVLGQRYGATGQASGSVVTLLSSSYVYAFHLAMSQNGTLGVVSETYSSGYQLSFKTFDVNGQNPSTATAVTASGSMGDDPAITAGGGERFCDCLAKPQLQRPEPRSGGEVVQWQFGHDLADQRRDCG